MLFVITPRSASQECKGKFFCFHYQARTPVQRIKRKKISSNSRWISGCARPEKKTKQSKISETKSKYFLFSFFREILKFPRNIRIHAIFVCPNLVEKKNWKFSVAIISNPENFRLARSFFIRFDPVC